MAKFIDPHAAAKCAHDLAESVAAISLDQGSKTVAEQTVASQYLKEQPKPTRRSSRQAATKPADSDGESGSLDKGTVLITHPACLRHSIDGHPEQPARVRIIMQALRSRFPELVPREAPRVQDDRVLLFHPQTHIDTIMGVCAKSEAAAERKAKQVVIPIDSDTNVMPHSREAILRAAGAVVYAVDEVMQGRCVNAFCCVRPPGHHAEPNTAMGFCFYNNAAIGALHAWDRYKARRVAVIDFDVHHGNGTEELFRKLPHTFYGSTHQGFGFYPGSGWDDVTGLDRNICNVMLRANDGSGPFRKAYRERILPELRRFKPELLVISAGFDAHKEDPLAEMQLEDEDYKWVTEQLCRVAEECCEGRVVSVLEGGYDLGALASSSVKHVQALMESAERLRTKAADHPSEDLADKLSLLHLTNTTAAAPLNGAGADAVPDSTRDAAEATPAPPTAGSHAEHAGNGPTPAASPAAPPAEAPESPQAAVPVPPEMQVVKDSLMAQLVQHSSQEVGSEPAGNPEESAVQLPVANRPVLASEGV